MLAYRIEQKGPRSLAEVIRSLGHDPIEARYTDPVSELRLETCQTRNGILFMDFARPRGGHGPGRMSKHRPLEHIRLENDESFGEDTGIAFNLVTNYAAVQYNHFGPRVTAIENYLNSYDLSLGGIRAPRGDERAEDLCGFAFGAVLRPDALAKLRSLGVMRELSFAVAVPGARETDLEAGRSLSQVLNAPLPEGIETLSISMSATTTKTSHLGARAVMGIVRDLQRLGINLHKAIVKGKVTIDDPIEQIDLIEERLSATADLNMADGRRYSRADRWAALRKALATWADARQLSVSPR